MSITLLLDLDDTLLLNSMNRFVPAYLQALSWHLSDFADPGAITQALLAGTRQMIANRRPDCTLKEVFDQVFYPALGVDREDMDRVIAEFYAGVYRDLGKDTQPNSAGQVVVETAIQRGYRLVVATNPIFPRTAIVQRLQWAGLDPERIPFAIIPSYESAHFAKPNPEYLAELLGWLGWPKDPVVMVGDDPTNDVHPANRLGVLSYWITEHQNGHNLPEGVHPNASGRLEDFIPWLDSVSEKDLQPQYDRTSSMLAVMRATPASLTHVVERISGQEWSRRPSQNEWSQTEILCHLRDVELEVNLPRVRKVLAEENPFISGQDTDPWAEARTYICQNGAEALAHYTQARIKLMELLEGMPASGWERTARHAIFGPTTLKEMVGIIAEHDRLHLRQLDRLTADRPK